MAPKSVMKKPANKNHEVADGQAMIFFKKMKAKLDEKKEGGTDLTKTEKTQLLDAKIEAYKETGGKGLSFDIGEMKCLYGRWESTQEPNAPQEVREM